MPFILSAGGGYLNESMDGLGLNDEKSAQILQNFADLINVYHVSPTAVQKNAMPSAANSDWLQNRQQCTLTEAGTIWIL